MNRVQVIFRWVHVVVWLLLSLLTAFQLKTEGDSDWFVLTAGFIVTCMYIFYGHFFLLTRYSGKKKKGAYLVQLTGIIFTGPFLFLLTHYKKLDSWDPFLGYYVMALISIVPIFIFLSWLARVTENLILSTIRKEQLEKQAVEAELYYLKSQINPHFLFNTLNNIHTLVYKRAQEAPQAVMQLASLMRYMIYESNVPTVPLSREMDYLKDYMSLQQLRYKKSPVVNLEITGEIESCNIAPLLFIHLMENAYKHSPGRLEPGDIKVRVLVIENALTFNIQNPVNRSPGNKLEEPGGIGLQNVRKRLALLYPDQHSLEINSTSETFNIILKIFGLHLQVYERKVHLLYN